MERDLPQWVHLLVCSGVGVFSELFFFTLAEMAEGNAAVRLETKTYLWMFPIWGFGTYSALAIRRSLPQWYVRLIPYIIYYFIFEYLTGALLYYTIGECPWDYSSSGSDFHCHGFARWDYAAIAPAIMYFGIEPAIDFVDGLTYKKKRKANS